MLRRSLRATSPLRRPGSAAADLPATPPAEDPSGSPADPVTAVSEPPTGTLSITLGSVPALDPGLDRATAAPAAAAPELDRAAAEPVASEPAATDRAAVAPAVAADPDLGRAATDPAATDPAATDPAATDPAAADLTDVAQVGTGPLRLDITRRPQHQRRARTGRAGGARPRITLVAVGLSTAAVGVLAIGTVQGIRADHDGSAVRDQAMFAVTPSPSVSLPDGRIEDVAANRANAAAAARAVQERAQAQAAAAAAAKLAAQQRAAQQAAAAAAAAKSRQQAAAQAARSASRSSAPTPSGSPQAIAQAMLAARGWSGQFSCLDSLWQRESGWNYRATNPSSGAYGIPQSLPGSKMASAGADWRTNPATQIRWGLSYIASTYGTPCAAWAHSQATGWY